MATSAPARAFDRDVAPSGEDVVVADHLTKRFGQVLAVDDLSFRLRAGSVTGFLGPNGAGKTTTLRMLLGLVRPTAGRALLFGAPYCDRNAPRVGAVLEASSFHPGRTGREHLMTLALAAKLPATRVDEALRLVGLSEAGRRRVGGYSLGMRQRLGLGAALLRDPELLILDEPANGLDPEGVHWLRTFMRGFATSGRTVLVSSHVLAEVAQTVDRVVIIDHGRLVEIAALGELTARLAGGVRVRAPGVQKLVPLLAARGIGTTVMDGDELLVHGASAELVGQLAAETGLALQELTQESSTLEEAFLQLTSGNEP